MYTPKIREVIRNKFNEDPSEARTIASFNVGFSLSYHDKPYLKYMGNFNRLENILSEIGYKKSKACKKINHNFPDNEFVERVKRPTSSKFTMYINKSKMTIILRETGWIHYTSGSEGYYRWDTFTVYKV